MYMFLKSALFPGSFELPSAEVTAVVNLVTTLLLLTVVSTILMPILSGSVVLVQRRSDDDPFVNTDYGPNHLLL